MGKRLSKITTKTGDTGKTGLASGKRIDKFSPKIEAIGTIDELNSFIGLFISHLNKQKELIDIYQKIQHHLFDVGGELAMEDVELIKNFHIEFLEEQIVKLNKDLPALEDFILPGGSVVLSHCHIVRAVCRRAERLIAKLVATENLNKNLLIYLNRLSDLAFITARYLAKKYGETEILWQKDL